MGNNDLSTNQKLVADFLSIEWSVANKKNNDRAWNNVTNTISRIEDIFGKRSDGDDVVDDLSFLFEIIKIRNNACENK